MYQLGRALLYCSNKQPPNLKIQCLIDISKGTSSTITTADGISIMTQPSTAHENLFRDLAWTPSAQMLLVETSDITSSKCKRGGVLPSYYLIEGGKLRYLWASLKFKSLIKFLFKVLPFKGPKIYYFSF